MAKYISLTSLFILAVVAMAVAPVAATGITYQNAASANNNAANTLTLPVPAGVAQGDVLIASLDVENSPSITIPAGWTLVRSDANPSALHLLQADYYHVVSASEPTNYSWTFSAADGASGGIIDYRGVDNSKPIDASSGATGNSNLAPILAPSVTTSVPNEMLVGVFGDGVNRSYTTPTGMTLRYSNSTTPSGSKTDILAYDQQLTNAGSTGSRSTTANGSSVWVAQLLALRPAAAVSQPPVVDSVAINQTTPETNDTLTATVAAHDPNGLALTYNYQWTLNGFNIPGATGQTLDLSQPGNGNKADLIALTVTAFNGQLYSQPVTSAPVTIVNSPPVISSASLSPSNPNSMDNLTVAVTATDADADPITYTYVWSVDSTAVQTDTTAAATDSLYLPNFAQAGDTVTVQITPFDGSADGSPVMDTAIIAQTVADRPPVVDSVQIAQANPKTNDTLSLLVASHDPDGDALTYTYQWQANGVNIPGASSPTLDLSQPGNGNVGDSIAATVTAFDGQLYSQPLTSAPVTIVNTPPVINSLSLSPVNPQPTDTLTAGLTASDADGDPISFSYTWSVNGIQVLSDNTASTSDSISVASYAQSGDIISVQVTPNDGKASGTALTASATVQPVSSFGQITEYSMPGSKTPANLTQGPDSNIWVTEESGANVVRVNVADGSMILFNAPVPATANGAIVTGPDGNLWFSEGLAGKIARLNPNTGALAEFKLLYSNSEPTGITVGPDGNLWFCDFGASKVGKITTSGVVTEYSTPTGLAQPHGMTTGSDGNMWFTEYHANKIGRVTTSGVVTEFPIPTASSGAIVITAGPDGNLWFTEQVANKIGRITASGAITEFSTGSSTMPVGITAAPDGNLWFVESKANKIASISTTGAITTYALPSPNTSPNRIAMGGDGNLWFTEHGVGRIARFSLY